MRAIEVIRKTASECGILALPAHDADLPGGNKLTIDVALEGKQYGIAFVTLDESKTLGKALPPANQKDERLRLTRVGADGETRVLLLYQQNYQNDDAAGNERQQSSMQSELELARDVKDFLTFASAKGFR